MAKANRNRASGTATGAARSGRSKGGGTRPAGPGQAAGAKAAGGAAKSAGSGAKAARSKDSARARIARMQAAEAQRRRRRLWTAVAGGIAAVAVAAVVIVLTTTGHTTSPPAKHGLPLRPLSTLGPLRPAPAPGRAGVEGVPIPAGPALAGLTSAATGQRVDGISCQSSEQSLFHIHAHLAIFVDGSARQVPEAIGIVDNRCLYWLHTHAADGIVHIESPVHRTFTLGQLFDEWGQPLGPGQVGPVSGRVVAIYNGKVFAGDPRDVPLTAHAQIQLEVGKPLIAPEHISFPGGL